MGKIIRSLALLLVFTLNSSAFQTDKQLERLRKEKANLTRQTDPVGRTKTQIKISEAFADVDQRRCPGRRYGNDAESTSANI